MIDRKYLVIGLVIIGIFISYIVYMNIINPDIRDYKVLKFYEIKEFHLGLGGRSHDYVTYIDDNGMEVTGEFYQGNFIRYSSEINEPFLRCKNGYCNLYVPNNYNYSKIQDVNKVYVMNP